MNNAHVNIIDGLRNPPLHATHMAVYPIPGHLRYEAANLLETLSPVELHRTDCIFVTSSLLLDMSNAPSLEELARDIA
jgi:hypothetical protein